MHLETWLPDCYIKIYTDISYFIFFELNKLHYAVPEVTHDITVYIIKHCSNAYSNTLLIYVGWFLYGTCFTQTGTLKSAAETIFAKNWSWTVPNKVQCPDPTTVFSKQFFPTNYLDYYSTITQCGEKQKIDRKLNKIQLNWLASLL